MSCTNLLRHTRRPLVLFKDQGLGQGQEQEEKDKEEDKEEDKEKDKNKVKDEPNVKHPQLFIRLPFRSGEGTFFIFLYKN